MSRDPVSSSQCLSLSSTRILLKEAPPRACARWSLPRASPCTCHATAWSQRGQRKPPASASLTRSPRLPRAAERSPIRSQGKLFATIRNRAFGLQKACRRRFGRRVAREESLQINGGRTWIRTTDLFLIRQAVSAPRKCSLDQGVRRGVTSALPRRRVRFEARIERPDEHATGGSGSFERSY
jgi:hypothetical protein